jgi:2-keto-3-deoxy-L-rhamnonate aldolase RhmA
MMQENQAKKLLKQGDVAFGTMIRFIRSPEIIPICATSGWDYVIIDTEHYAYSPETIANLALLASYEELCLLVRVPDKLYFQLAQTLDFGVSGLVIPRVETGKEIDAIVEATKYHPLGLRGASKASVASRFPDVSTREYLEWANRETLIVVQIESELGVENVDRLLSAEGIDAVMIGPFDLSQSMGIPGETEHPRIVDAYHRIIEACDRYGVAPGIHLQSFESVERWLREGMRFVTFQYDMSFLRNKSEEVVKRLKKIQSS